MDFILRVLRLLRRELKDTIKLFKAWTGVGLVEPYNKEL